MIIPLFWVRSCTDVLPPFSSFFSWSYQTHQHSWGNVTELLMTNLQWTIISHEAIHNRLFAAYQLSLLLPCFRGFVLSAFTVVHEELLVTICQSPNDLDLVIQCPSLRLVFTRGSHCQIHFFTAFLWYVCCKAPSGAGSYLYRNFLTIQSSNINISN